MKIIFMVLLLCPLSSMAMESSTGEKKTDESKYFPSIVVAGELKTDAQKDEFIDKVVYAMTHRGPCPHCQAERGAEQAKAPDTKAADAKDADDDAKRSSVPYGAIAAELHAEWRVDRGSRRWGMDPDPSDW